jgi:hypothetical protein
MSNMVVGALVIVADLLITAFPAKSEHAFEMYKQWRRASQNMPEDTRYYGSIGYVGRLSKFIHAAIVAPEQDPDPTEGEDAANDSEEIRVVSDAPFTAQPVKSSINGSEDIRVVSAASITASSAPGPSGGSMTDPNSTYSFFLRVLPSPSPSFHLAFVTPCLLSAHRHIT